MGSCPAINCSIGFWITFSSTLTSNYYCCIGQISPPALFYAIMTSSVSFLCFWIVLHCHEYYKYWSKMVCVTPCVITVPDISRITSVTSLCTWSLYFLIIWCEHIYSLEPKWSVICTITCVTQIQNWWGFWGVPNMKWCWSTRLFLCKIHVRSPPVCQLIRMGSGKCNWQMEACLDCGRIALGLSLVISLKSINAISSVAIMVSFNGYNFAYYLTRSWRLSVQWTTIGLWTVLLS